MLSALTGNAFITIAALVFVASLLLLEGLYLLWASHRGNRARRIARRLRMASPGEAAQVRLTKQRQLSGLPVFERMLRNTGPARRLERYLVQSGLKWRVAPLLLGSVGLGLLLLFLLDRVARTPLPIALAGGALAGALPMLYVVRLRARRLQKLETQLPDALDLITRALRSGHAFGSGLSMVGEEMPEPIASEFRAVHEEINFGVSLQQALGNLAERVPGTDLRYFVVSVLIQRESGGNLTEVLGNLSRLIRERLKLMARVRILSSEGRLSARILIVMPFGLAGVINLVNPEFMAPLWTDPIGIRIVQYMLTLMAIGILIMRKITRLRY